MKGQVTESLKGIGRNRGRRYFRTCCTVLPIGMGLIIADAEAQKPPQPEKIGVVYQLQGDSLTEIPRLTGKKKTSTFITARSKIRMELQGGTSETKIDKDSNPTFAVALPTGDISKLLLFPLKVGGNKREAVIGSGGSIYGESAAGAETLPLDVVKASSDSYRITSAAVLKPGEYAFAFAGSNEFFCFTVR